MYVYFYVCVRYVLITHAWLVVRIRYIRTCIHALSYNARRRRKHNNIKLRKKLLRRRRRAFFFAGNDIYVRSNRRIYIACLIFIFIIVFGIILRRMVWINKCIPFQ